MGLQLIGLQFLYRSVGPEHGGFFIAAEPVHPGAALIDLARLILGALIGPCVRKQAEQTRKRADAP